MGSNIYMDSTEREGTGEEEEESLDALYAKNKEKKEKEGE